MPRRQKIFSGKPLLDLGSKKALFGWVKVPTRYGFQETQFPFKIRRK